MSLPLKLKNYNVFNDGHSYLGKSDEIVLPKLTAKMEEWRGGGMDIPVDVDLGMEKLTMEWTIGGYAEQIFKQFGILKVDGVMLRFAGALQAEDSAEVRACEVVVRGRHSEIDMGTSKAGDDTSLKVVSSLTYYKLSINNEVLIEIDALNMVKKIAGDDIMTPFRRALGI